MTWLHAPRLCQVVPLGCLAAPPRTHRIAHLQRRAVAAEAVDAVLLLQAHVQLSGGCGVRAARQVGGDAGREPRADADAAACRGHRILGSSKAGRLPLTGAEGLGGLLGCRCPRADRRLLLLPLCRH